MRMRRWLTVGCVSAAAATFSFLSFAQAPERQVRPGDFKIRAIHQQLVVAPDYRTVTTGAGTRGSALSKKWLQIEVEFDSAPEWADDVTVRYYVLIGTGAKAKMFTGSVTYVNVAKGRSHFSAMFMHPNAVERFGNGRVEAVAAQLLYQNRLMDQDSVPPSNARWWESYEPTTGFLLTPGQTPWSLTAFERYEQIKYTAGQGQ